MISFHWRIRIPLMLGLSLLWNSSVAQCDNDNDYYTSVFPFGPGTTTVYCIDAGSYVEVEVVEGYTYTFSTCNYQYWNVGLTLYGTAFGEFIDYNEDFCDDGAQITWVATYSGFVDILVDEENCSDDDECMDLDITVDLPNNAGDGCNTDVILCQNFAGPFDFGIGGPPVSSCQDFFFNSQFAYIMVNITTTGPLSLLIEGDATDGFLDVSVFNIPDGIDPCEAIQDIDNEIGCNYASAFSGCNQFGNFFGCPSTVPSPIVTAGQTIMIVVEDWQNGSSDNFTLQLGPPPYAQSGPPDPSSFYTGPYCVSETAVQLAAVDMGGVWTGANVTTDGIFNPSAAGVGFHTVHYEIGAGTECFGESDIQVEVVDVMVTSPIAHN